MKRHLRQRAELPANAMIGVKARSLDWTIVRTQRSRMLLRLITVALACVVPSSAAAGELTSVGYTKYLHQPIASWTEDPGEQVIEMDVSRATPADVDGYFVTGPFSDVPSRGTSFTMKQSENWPNPLLLGPGTWYVHVLYEITNPATGDYTHRWSNILSFSIPDTRKPAIASARMSIYWGSLYSWADDRARVRIRVCDDSRGMMIIRAAESERAGRYRRVHEYRVRPPRYFGTRCHTYRLAWKFPSAAVGGFADPYRISVKVRDIEMNWSRARSRSWYWADV